jgi:hypothetical protein
MPYTRSRVRQKFWSGYPTQIKKIYAIELYNCQARIKGHYPKSLPRMLTHTECHSWESNSDYAYPSPTPDFHSNDPIGCDVMFEQVGYDLFNADLDRTTNKAYAKFTDKMKDSAQNANNMLEVGQSVRQIAQHVATIAKTINAVKKGDVAGAARALGISNPGSVEQRIKRRAKQASDRWLELHFGWEPLVQDIGANIDILQGTGKSSSKIQEIVTKSGASFQGQHSIRFPTNPGNGYVDYGRDMYSCNIGVSMWGQVSVENPNVAIANQMGFVNPLSVAWEAVPFSFVVDWFSNVGQCLGAMTDFFGFLVANARTSSWYKVNQNRVYTRSNSDGRLIKDEFHSVSLIRVGRVTGITAPRLHLTPFKGFGPARGATAVSLLVQQMGKINSK